MFSYFYLGSDSNMIVLVTLDRIRMDIDIINMGFECSYMDTVSDVEYSNLDTNRSQLIL